MGSRLGKTLLLGAALAVLWFGALLASAESREFLLSRTTDTDIGSTWVGHPLVLLLALAVTSATLSIPLGTTRLLSEWSACVLVALILGVAPTNAWAADWTIEAETDVTVVDPDDQITYTVRMAGTSGTPTIESGPDVRDFVVLNQATSSRVQIINGAMTREFELVWRLKPKVTGTVEIGGVKIAVGGEIYDAPPVVVEIEGLHTGVPQPAPGPNANSGTGTPSGPQPVPGKTPAPPQTGPGAPAHDVAPGLKRLSVCMIA